MKRLFTLFFTCVLSLSLSAMAFAAPLIVAHDTEFKPFEYKGKDGKYTGFDIELWKRIAEISDLDYTFQPMSFNGIVPALQAGNIDAGIAGMTITDQRRAVVDFSTPYYDSGLMILVRNDENGINSLDDLAGKNVAVKTGTSSVNFMQAFGKAKELKLFPNNDGMFFELMSKGVDAVLFDMPVVKEFSMTAGNGKVKVVGPVYEGQSYGIGFPKGSPLVSKVDAAIKQMKESGEYDKLYIKWFGYAPIKK